MSGLRLNNGVYMYRLIVGLFLIATLSGCAAPKRVPIQVAESKASASIAQPLPSTCSMVSEHLTKDGEVVPTSYRCLTVESIVGVPAGACTSVSGYYRQDGYYVAPHQRCQISAFLPYGAKSAQGSSNAPCVTSVCGPVSVKGYTRKDGTYVQPHTRSRAKK